MNRVRISENGLELISTQLHEALKGRCMPKGTQQVLDVFFGRGCGLLRGRKGACGLDEGLGQFLSLLEED